MPLAAGDHVTPTLRLVRPLGEGGMGHVWVAFHLGLRSQVAVKFLSEALSQNEAALGRFSREAAAASQVKSPHVVHMIDFGVATNGKPYIAMELLEGRDLSQILARFGTLDPGGVSNIVTQVARALMRAHEKGIVHRDLKPENIFLTDAGGGEIFTKVLDFGVAKAATMDGVRTTGTGMMIGTPLYMSPEQVLGSKAIDHRSDLWSLGVVAFEVLTGGVPFPGETVGAISVAICHAPLPKPSDRNAAIGPAVDQWFLRACARDPEERFGSAKDMADALATAIRRDGERLLEPEPISTGDPPSASSARELPGLLSATMVELSEPTTVWRPPRARRTTNGATALPQSTTAEGVARRGRRRLLALGSGILVLAVAAVVIVVRSRSEHVNDESSQRAARRPAIAASTTMVDSSASAKSPEVSPTAPQAIDAVPAMTIASPAEAASATPKVTTSTAIKAAAVIHVAPKPPASAKPTASTSPAASTTKKKPDVVIE